MKLSDYDFDLPEALIATRPVKPRSSARLLVADGAATRDAHVYDLPEILRPGDRLVLNDTRVLPVRLSGERHRKSRDGGGVARIEVTLLEPQPGGGWSALAKPMRKLKMGESVLFDGGLEARIRSLAPLVLDFNKTGQAFEDALQCVGAMPLPPYIAGKRPADAQDREDYQTVWARHAGAVAAPTASLHFDGPLLDALGQAGIEMSHVTLHVGAGTFLPVTVDDVTTHKMHPERGEITQQAAGEINATRAVGGRIIPVGTTALRLIESAARDGTALSAWSGATDIFIYPGFEFRLTDALMTNFHLPKSTLMMLVSALMGRERMMEVYGHAIAAEYRFFSYGDASLLIPSRA